jgi:hypothetical protein
MLTPQQKVGSEMLRNIAIGVMQLFSLAGYVLAETEVQYRFVGYGESQNGMYYELETTAGPWTATEENSGRFCGSQTIEAGSTTKHNLACTALYALFQLNANWSTEQASWSSTRCEGCCEGPLCTIPKIYIHRAFTYKQVGWRKQIRSRSRDNIFSPWSAWSDWEFTLNCDTGYCLLKTRTGYSCAGENLDGTYEMPLLEGVPECED